MVQINTISTVDAVRNAIEADILSLHFAPGEKITEIELSARYGVSRNTVREAIAHLLAQGLLTKIANKGIFVRRFTVEDVQEIFHLRVLLEAEAIRSIISQSELTSNSLYNLVAALEQTDRQANWDIYVKNDIQFHTELVACANSPRLSRLYDSILTEVKLCIHQTRNYVQVPANPNTSHRMILDAIENKDEQAALSLLTQHIEHVIKRYCGGLIAMDNPHK